MNVFDSKAFINALTTRPGVYQMLDAKGNVLYVGKARNLKDRVSSYFRPLQHLKTIALVQQIANITVTVTQTENEALLLENNLIKSFLPRYNILLKDDKSYPYLFLSAHPEFPRLDFYRGPQVALGEYFGPYPSAGAVHETLDLLQKLFKIRQCSDTFFKSRTRPCLQYQIKRCTAPCVGFIKPEQYQMNVQHARLFLRGKNEEVLQALVNKMEQASACLAFEEAAQYRDQLKRLRQIETRQYVIYGKGDVDVIACGSSQNVVCVQLLYIRGGRLIGNKSFFPEIPMAEKIKESLENEVLSAFLPQYYLSSSRGESFPENILLDRNLSEKHWIQMALIEGLQRKISISHPKRGVGVQWLQMARLNVQQALANHLSSKLNYYQCLEALQTVLQLSNLPERMECFDISHTMGEATVASCVVFGREGPIKQAYRRFNITGIVPGDDYAAMAQALTRRYTRLKAANGLLPDILMIDGGKGQLAKAIEVLEVLQVSGIILLGIAKGEGRKPGLEKIFLPGALQPLPLLPDSPALHLIQRVRDEAHRFAIVGHRQQRAKARTTSRLQDIEGISVERRRRLLRHFGGMQGVVRASIEDLTKVPGIGLGLAKRIYEALHNDHP